MQSTVYFLLVTFGSSIVLGDESALCKTWSDIEKSLRNENFMITCTMNKDCLGLNCSGDAHGYNVHSRIQLYACENPPSIQFEVNIPRLNIKDFKKRIYHNDSIALTKNLKIDFDVERKKQKLVLGLFAHLLNNGSFPLLRIPMRIPVISNVEFPIDCLSFEETTVQPMSVSSGISVVSSSPTRSFLLVAKGNDGYSNCSITNSTCGEEEICKQINKLKPDGVCVCISNYTRNDDGKCIYTQPVEASSVSLLLTAILVPIFVIIVLVAAIYASIRFRVFQHLRRRMRVQVYEHVLLGEDDDDEDLENPVA